MCVTFRVRLHLPASILKSVLVRDLFTCSAMWKHRRLCHPTPDDSVSCPSLNPKAPQSSPRLPVSRARSSFVTMAPANPLRPNQNSPTKKRARLTDFDEVTSASTLYGVPPAVPCNAGRACLKAHQSARRVEGGTRHQGTPDRISPRPTDGAKMGATVMGLRMWRNKGCSVAGVRGAGDDQGGLSCERLHVDDV